MRLILTIATASILLTGCGPTTPRTTLSDLPSLPSAVIDSSWAKAKEKAMSGLTETSSLRGLKTPVLLSPILAKTWGVPTKESSPEGFYRLSYQDPNKPFERLVIYGSPRPFPSLITPPKMSKDTMVNGELGSIEVAQKWRATTILGKPVRWYQESAGGGADGAYYETEGFALTDPDGKTGYYHLVIESITDAAPARFRNVGW
jgi:hypothetical protein